VAKQKQRLTWFKAPRTPHRRAARIDETIDIRGHGRAVRQGATVELNVNRTSDEHIALTQRLADNHAGVVHEIQTHVDACAEIVAAHDPVVLLFRAYVDFFAGSMGKRAEHEMEFAQTVDVRMLDYLQALVVSVPRSSVALVLDQAKWNELRSHVERLFENLLHVWPLTQSATFRSQAGADPDDDVFSTPLLLDWLSVRGWGYFMHKRERLAALLAPHEEALLRLFGTDVAGITGAVHEIQRRLTSGLAVAMRTVEEIREAAFSDANIALCAVPDDADHREMAWRLTEQTGRADELRRAVGRAFDTDLFDVSDLLPSSLLRCISLSPGDDNHFFGQGPYRGWPLRTPATLLCPILFAQERFWAFDPYTVDYFYRAIQRAVCETDPGYKESWKLGQNVATEGLSVALLSSLLPGARVFRSVVYPVREGGVTKWCECDAVMVLDELLIVVEVKAGRATERSPWEDIDAHRRNVKSLLLSPCGQAARFLQYLDSATEVDLYDGAHAVVGRLRGKSTPMRVPCAVTVDSMSALAGSFQHAGFVSQGQPINPTWCVSIDNLFAYRDVLQGPVTFCHFLLERLRAFPRADLASLDELDHLGAYLETNAYTRWTADFAAHMVALVGYRGRLDTYFADEWETGALGAPPNQPLSPVLRAIIAALERGAPRGFLAAGAALLDLNADARRTLGDAILESRGKVSADSPSRVITARFQEIMIFVAVIADVTPPPDRRIYVKHAIALLAASKERRAQLLECWMTDDGQVTRAGCEILDLDSLPTWRVERSRHEGRDIAAGRFRQAKLDGIKLGRNDRCLCGSGKKYKQCCLKR